MARPKTLIEALRFAASQPIELRFQTHPGRVTSYRYPEVLERARRVAGGLLQRGVKHGVHRFCVRRAVSTPPGRAVRLAMQIQLKRIRATCLTWWGWWRCLRWRRW